MDFLNTYFLRPIGLGWETPAETNITLQQANNKRKIDDRDRVDVISLVPALNTVTNTAVEPKAKRQKLTHEQVEQKQAENTEKRESLSINLVEDDVSEEEIVEKPNKILPSKLAKPNNILQFDRALKQLEQFHHEKLIDLDIGDISLERILLPLRNKGSYVQSDAWLSDFFVINFIKEKIASSGRNDILLYDFNVNSANLYLNMQRVANYNQDNGIKKIIWPICDAKHFYLVTIDYDIENNNVYLHAFDGFNGFEQQNKFLKKAEYFAKLFYPQANTYVQTSQPIVAQGNAMDCSLVACYYASHFIKKTAMQFQEWVNTFSTPKPIEGMKTQQPYTPYRKKVAEAFFVMGNRQLPEQTQESQQKIVIEVG